MAGRALATVVDLDHQEHVAEIRSCMASGAVAPRADRVFPLERIIEAFALFENNEGRGNTVVRIGGEQPQDQL